MSNSRLEKFIYAICGMEVDDLPTPLSRIETLWNCLITGEMPDFEPLSRNEKYLMAMLNDNVDGLPEPTSRGEKLLYKIATGETDLSDVPGYLSRYEELLKRLIENGGIGGTDFEYVLYTLNQPLSTLYSTAEDIVNAATIYGDTVVNTLQEPSDLAVTPIGENIDISNTTVNGTVEGKVKSAILKGQTLVNVNRSNFIAKSNITTDYTNNIPFFDTNMKASTTYTIIAYSDNLYNYRLSEMRNEREVGLGVLTVGTPFVYTTDTAFTGLRGYLKGDILNIPKGTEIKILIVEGDHSNEGIPYFEGMQSVKMPVLTTTGKNLWSYGNNLGEFDIKYIKVSIPRGSYYFSGEPSKTYEKPVVVVLRDKTKQLIAYGYLGNCIKTDFDIDEVVIYSNGYNYANSINNFLSLKNFMMEKDTFTGIYEPHKTNILTVNDPIELRGIGDVKDTLDGNTGELTQRIGEIVLDGSETIIEWQNTNVIDGIKAFSFRNCADNNTTNVNSLSDTYITYQSSGKLNMANGEGVSITSNHCYLKILTSKLETSDIDGLKKYLSQNPITVQYELAEESVKTVDLSITDQDGNETSHLHVFNDTTHISTSAECLLPNVVIPADISYPSIIKANTLYTVKLKRPVTNGNLLINLGGTEQLVTSDCFTIQTPATLTSQNVIFSGKGNVISEVTVVEGDHTEKEYGYFEGMMSVQMPVLTTTGKNLFDSSTEIITGQGINSSNGLPYNYPTHSRTGFLRVKPNTSYTITQSHNKTWVFAYDKNKEYIKVVKTDVTSGGNFTTPNDTHYIRLDFNTVDTSEIVNGVQIEEGTVATSYEPFKTNILTTPQDFVLGKVEEFEDTINTTNGELIIKTKEISYTDSKIKPVVYISKPNSFYLRFIDKNPTKEKLIISDTIMQTNNWGSFMNNNNNSLCSYSLANANLYITIPNATTVEDADAFLTELNPTFRYVLAESTIKTVVLSTLDQDGQPTKLSTFNDVTHVSIEAEDLLPTVDLEVPTKIEETLSTLPTQMIDISEKQQSLNESIDDQAENINEVSTAITEIRNDIL